MNSRLLKKVRQQFGIGLLATAIVIGTIATWAYLDQRRMKAQGRVFYEKRYPVKAGKPKPKPTLSPLPLREALPMNGSGSPPDLAPN